MKRPALLIGLPYVLGLMLASVTVQQLWIPVCGGVTLVALAVMLWRREWGKYVLLGTLSCLTACCVYWQKEASSFGQQTDFAGQEAAFTGQITDVVVYQSGYARYYLDGILYTLNDSVPANIELFCDESSYEYGETLTLTGTPELVESGYLYDSAAYAKARGVALSFFMPEIGNTIPPEHPTLRSVIYNWRTQMTERILDAMGEETGPLLVGMLFGDKSGMSRSSKTAFYRMGIGHVLAVSGLHLDFLAVCVSWILEKLRTGRKSRFLLIAVICRAFVICAGETVSVKRAFIMVLLRESGTLAARKANTLNSLSIAMLLLGLENPFVIHNAAFWLSCTAVWGIGVFGPYMTKGMKMNTFLRKQKRGFLICCWAFLAILPVSALYFREVSLISPVSNTLLVPVCMLSMLLGMAAILLGGRSWLALLLFRGAGVLNGVILDISEAIARIPRTYASTGSSMLLPLLGAGIFLAAGCHVLERSRKLTAGTILTALAVTCAITGTEQKVKGNDLRIAVLGSGKDCVFVLAAADEAVIVDMGGASGAAAYADAYLTETGIRRIGALYLCRPTARNAAEYTEYFTLLPPERICLFEETENVPELPGGTTQIQNCWEQVFQGAGISAETEQLLVQYAGTTFLCAPETCAPEEAPEVLLISGRNKSAVPECGILIIPDAKSPYRRDAHTRVGETNLELTIAADGTCRIRRLYGNT